MQCAQKLWPHFVSTWRRYDSKHMLHVLSMSKHMLHCEDAEGSVAVASVITLAHTRAASLTHT